MKKRKGDLRFFALSQIFIMVVSMIAIAYILGSEFRVVSAAGDVNCVEVNGGLYRIPTNSHADAIVKYCNKKQYGGCRDSGLTVNSLCGSHPEACASGGSSGLFNILPGKKTECLPAVTSQAQTAGTPPSTPNPLSQAQAVAGTAVINRAVDAGVNAVTRKIGGTVATRTGGKIVGVAAKKATIRTTKGLAPVVATEGSLVSWIITNAGYAALIYVGTQAVFRYFGASPELANSVSAGATGGYIAGAIAAKLGLVSGLGTLGVGFVVGGAIFLATYKEEKRDLVSFSCFPWSAQSGGKNCELCNKQELPCTEYACKSLGQACELVNQGTGNELCVWKNSKDIIPPVIQPWVQTLTMGYKYTPDNAISPPDRGVKIVKGSDNGCIAAFTPIKFGLTLDEPGKCKWDISNKKNFKEMSNFFQPEVAKYNHSLQTSIPGVANLEEEGVTLQNGGEAILYVRCEDANGNSNIANFVFKLCVDKGPDKTAPLIETTSILNGAPVSFGQTSVPLEVYLNEPSECKWSQVDQNYDAMENQMECVSSVLDVNAQMLYKCSTTLTGLKDRTDNKYYFRCRDQPSLKGTVNESKRNTNTQSYKFTLKGTSPLVITSISPNSTTIKDSTDVIRVVLKAETFAGQHEGDATCSFSDTGEDDSYVDFFDTGTSEHSQDLHLPAGDYTYYIKCTDLGGNTDATTTSFTVEADSQPPIAVRVFHQGSNLNVITNENATCVYGNTDCTYLYEDGIKMTKVSSKVNSAPWSPDKSFYIKCQDSFGNQPGPSECSIVAKPFEVKK